MSPQPVLAFHRSHPRSALAIGLVVAIGLMFLSVSVVSALGKTSGGEVGVVRNGGWFDDNQIREVIRPGSPLTWIGYFSSVHRYPAQQRFYTMTADPARGGHPGVDLVHTPSSDGVEMGIEAILYFNVNIDENTIKLFDRKFGTRQFLGPDGRLRYAWDGVQGWNTFFDATVRPIIENDLRIQISRFRCAELVSSCALVQNRSSPAAAGQIGATATGPQNNSNIAQIQQAINDSLPGDIRDSLGGDFFQNFEFNLVRVTLPSQIQDAVDKAQAAFAAVSEAQARALQARADADANKLRQQGYSACPACAQIDIIKALPPGITTYAPGAGTTVPLNK